MPVDRLGSVAGVGEARGADEGRGSDDEAFQAWGSAEAYFLPLFTLYKTKVETRGAGLELSICRFVTFSPTPPRSAGGRDGTFRALARDITVVASRMLRAALLRSPSTVPRLGNPASPDKATTIPGNVVASGWGAPRYPQSRRSCGGLGISMPVEGAEVNSTRPNSTAVFPSLRKIAAKRSPSLGNHPLRALRLQSGVAGIQGWLGDVGGRRRWGLGRHFWCPTASPHVVGKQRAPRECRGAFSRMGCRRQR